MNNPKALKPAEQHSYLNPIVMYGYRMSVVRAWFVQVPASPMKIIVITFYLDKISL